ncbi:hypothetical protein CEUSTIGMA_g9379.t1 [Chlamydomonas eustigma]|uniref:Uncharacterized protein n=1 Tax=Chlamydomonas eustigma TaxID=1157962 RepID=A0A250XFV1_9CHLO|nr:hypothetical protein CEUSTIGMA_g9379.t1 [Chlamydomonas eustigma]|eukprot:GAX81951.1 hypothetical protein CEUSTIGMA_g9379.t1 [Chlamydomonas eustigma]
MDLEEVGKILGVCRLMRFNPQHLLGALYPKFLSSEGSMSLSRLQVDASFSILDILPNLLTSLYALSKGPPDLVVDMLFSACCVHASSMQNRHLIFLAKWLNTRNAVVGRGAVGAHTTTLEGQGMNSGESVGSLMTCAQDLKNNQACWKLRLSSAVSKAVLRNLNMFSPEELMYAACAVPRLPLSKSRQEATRKLAHAVLPILIYVPGWQLVSMADAFASSGLRSSQLADAIAAEAVNRTEQRFIAPRGGTASKQSGRTQQGGQNVEESLDAQALQKLAEAVMRLSPSEIESLAHVSDLCRLLSSQS